MLKICMFSLIFVNDNLAKVRPHLLSSEQLRAWNENGYLKLKNAIPSEMVNKLNDITKELERKAELIHKKQVLNNDGILVHHEAVKSENDSEVVRICRIENFCSSELGLDGWSNICFDVIQDVVGQLYGEEAVLFKDKVPPALSLSFCVFNYSFLILVFLTIHF